MPVMSYLSFDYCSRLIRLYFTVSALLVPSGSPWLSLVILGYLYLASIQIYVISFAQLQLLSCHFQLFSEVAAR